MWLYGRLSRDAGGRCWSPFATIADLGAIRASGPACRAAWIASRPVTGYSTDTEPNRPTVGRQRIFVRGSQLDPLHEPAADEPISLKDHYRHGAPTVATAAIATSASWGSRRNHPHTGGVVKHPPPVAVAGPQCVSASGPAPPSGSVQWHWTFATHACRRQKSSSPAHNQFALTLPCQILPKTAKC